MLHHLKIVHTGPLRCLKIEECVFDKRRGNVIVMSLFVWNNLSIKGGNNKEFKEKSVNVSIQVEECFIREQFNIQFTRISFK